jgi:GDPmannose 4,6-dehydratase
MAKVAFITGVTGQDGAYLAELLLDKGYEVHALRRRTSVDNTVRVRGILNHPNLHTHYGDLTDASGLLRLFSKIRPDEVYNLGAQSHVRISFDIPEYTGDVDGLGTTRMLECIRTLDLDCKFYQASTSELYGKVVETPQTETTPFYPRSPYGVAKLYSYWIVKNYRESYDMFACNGILFNHESPLRGDDFVTQKVVQGLVNIYKGNQDILTLGNLDAQRDWGHAKDFVKGMWLMLQQDKPDDFVLATGELHSVRELIEFTTKQLWGSSVTWEGKDIIEKGWIGDKQIINCSEEYYRPAEVDLLLGDSTKARTELEWQPEYDFEKLITEMIDFEMERVQ